MAGLFESMKGLSKPPDKISDLQLPTLIVSPDWGQGEGKQKLTPETASKSAASVIR